MNTDKGKKKALVKKLRSEPNKYFVPGKGQIEATDLRDVEKKLKEKEEDGDGNI